MKKPEFTNGKFAERVKIELYRPEVEIVLKLLGHPEAFVTDESWLCDFHLDDMELKQLREKLGFQVGSLDFIWQIAKRYREYKSVNLLPGATAHG